MWGQHTSVIGAAAKMARGAEKEVSWKIGGEFSGEIDCKVYLGQDWFLIIFAAPAIGEKLCIGIFCSRIFFLVLCTINISFTCKWAFVIQFATNLLPLCIRECFQPLRG